MSNFLDHLSDRVLLCDGAMGTQVQARDLELSQSVALAAKHRILDTLGAVVSGARLKPGEVAIDYVRGQAGVL